MPEVSPDHRLFAEPLGRTLEGPPLQPDMIETLTLRVASRSLE